MVENQTPQLGMIWALILGLVGLALLIYAHYRKVNDPEREQRKPKYNRNGRKNRTTSTIHIPTSNAIKTSFTVEATAIMGNAKSQPQILIIDAVSDLDAKQIAENKLDVNPLIRWEYKVNGKSI